MAKLIEVATRVQDLYYQNYTPNDAFLDIEDFKYWVAVTYSSMLNTIYQGQRRENRQMDGFSNIEISAAWLLPQELLIQCDKNTGDFFIELNQPIFSFDFDGAANGLQGVHSIGGTHHLYRKISLNERRFRQIVPPVSAVLYYLYTTTKIRLWGKGPGLNPTTGATVEVQMIPAVAGSDNDCLLSDNIVGQLSLATLDMLFKAKNGNFIQKVDDQNPNTPAPQGNPALPGQ